MSQVKRSVLAFFGALAGIWFIGAAILVGDQAAVHPFAVTDWAWIMTSLSMIFCPFAAFLGWVE